MWPRAAAIPGTEQISKKVWIHNKSWLETGVPKTNQFQLVTCFQIFQIFYILMFQEVDFLFS